MAIKLEKEMPLYQQFIQLGYEELGPSGAREITPLIPKPFKGMKIELESCVVLGRYVGSHRYDLFVDLKTGYGFPYSKFQEREGLINGDYARTHGNMCQFKSLEDAREKGKHYLVIKEVYEDFMRKAPDGSYYTTWQMDYEII